MRRSCAFMCWMETWTSCGVFTLSWFCRLKSVPNGGSIVCFLMKISFVKKPARKKRKKRKKINIFFIDREMVLYDLSILRLMDYLNKVKDVLIPVSVVGFLESVSYVYHSLFSRST